FEDPSRYPLRSDLIVSERTLWFIAVSAAALAVFYVAQRLVHDPHWPRLWFLHTMAVGAPTLLALQAAIGLVQTAVQPSLLAPNLHLEVNPFGLAVAAAAILIAFSFITGIADWIGAIALVALCGLAFNRFPPLDALSQVFWAGIAVFVLIIGRPASTVGHVRPWFARRGVAWSARAVAVLRLITGVAIVAPALDEKIWNPAIGAAFLAAHPQFNFMRTFLGQAWFSDDL